jgi:hypothetical protein
MRFAAAERIADAVLFEGYVLYPYRASSVKNRLRWQFGVIAPQFPCGEGEPSFSQTECLIEPMPSAAGPGPAKAGHYVPVEVPVEREVLPEHDAPVLSIRVRCLRPQYADPVPADERAGSVVSAVGGTPLTGVDEPGALAPWLEGVPLTVDIAPIRLDDVPRALTFELPDLAEGMRLGVDAEHDGTLVKIRLRLENHAPWRAEYADDRDRMLCASIVGAHLLLSIEHGQFVSMVDPPAAAADAVARCVNRHTWPVLVGDRRERTLLMSSPIVLYDYPAVAPQSRGDLFDAAEIDEILSLRILTLTDEEKRAARATDPRAGAILDRVEALGPDDLAALHGTMRSADFFNPPDTPPPDEAFVIVDGQRIAKGTRVRLRPNRRADAMDLFLAGQPATVAGVFRDVDDRVYVAITVDADPAASLHASFGRFFYFDPTEVECI